MQLFCFRSTAFSLFLLASVTLFSQQAQWMQLAAFEGGDVNAVCALSNNVVIAATKQSIYRSTDNCATWQRITRRVNGVVALVSDTAGRVYAAGETGLFASDDGGLVWFPV